MNLKNLSTMTDDVVKLHQLMGEYERKPRRRRSEWRKPGVKQLKRTRSKEMDFFVYNFTSSERSSEEDELPAGDESEVHVT